MKIICSWNNGNCNDINFKDFFTTIKTCVQHSVYLIIQFCYLMSKMPSSVFWLTTNNVNLKLSTFIIFKVVPGIQFWITILQQMPSHVSHICRQFSGSSPLCVTDWKNATSFRIYIWVLRLQMMQSLQSTSTQSSRGLSKVSAYWVANLYRTKPAVLLNITTLWERDIVNKTLHGD